MCCFKRPLLNIGCCLISLGFTVGALSIISYGILHYNYSDCVTNNKEIHRGTMMVTNYFINMEKECVDDDNGLRKYYSGYSANIYGYYQLGNSHQNITCMFEDSDDKFCCRKTIDEATFCAQRSYIYNTEFTGLSKNDQCGGVSYETCNTYDYVNNALIVFIYCLYAIAGGHFLLIWSWIWNTCLADGWNQWKQKVHNRFRLEPPGVDPPGGASVMNVLPDSLSVVLPDSLSVVLPDSLSVVHNTQDYGSAA